MRGDHRRAVEHVYGIGTDTHIQTDDRRAAGFRLYRLADRATVWMWLLVFSAFAQPKRPIGVLLSACGPVRTPTHR